jgi:hypothetical protein
MGPARISFKDRKQENLLSTEQHINHRRASEGGGGSQDPESEGTKNLSGLCLELAWSTQ